MENEFIFDWFTVPSNIILNKYWWSDIVNRSELLFSVHEKEQPDPKNPKEGKPIFSANVAAKVL